MFRILSGNRLRVNTLSEYPHEHEDVLADHDYQVPEDALQRDSYKGARSLSEE
jgi:hypothetical protein